MCNEQTLPSDSILFKPISVPVLAQDSDVLITSLSNNFYNYTIDPPLPKNLVLQPGTGTISGFLIEGAHGISFLCLSIHQRIILFLLRTLPLILL